MAEQPTLISASIHWAHPESNSPRVFMPALGTAHHLTVLNGREGQRRDSRKLLTSSLLL